MPSSATHNRWLTKVVEQLRALEGVEYEALKDGRIALEISYDGDSRKVFMAGAARELRDQKNQYSQIREALTELGIKEGLTFVADKRSRNRMTPEILAARAKKKKDFNAWQAVWRTIREAEKALDVEYEISQMLDYY